MNEYERFKHLLEYFVAHLEFCETGQKENDRYHQYIKPIINFKRSGQGHKGGNIQNQIKDWEFYNHGFICININATGYTSRGCYLNWEDTAININAIWSSSTIIQLKIVKDSYPISNAKDVLTFSIDELGLFDNNMPNDILKSFFDKFNLLIIEYNGDKQGKREMENIQPYLKLLEEVKNLILTGAPGTGKTFLAKQIAKHIIGVKTDEELEQSEQFAFVQFHPSYDYTDFVEGLRPIKPDVNGNIGFELKNGIFKEFCKKALGVENDDKFDELYTEFINELSEDNRVFQTPMHKKKFKIEINSNHTCVAIPETEIGTRMSITKDMIKEYIYSGVIRDWKPYTIPVGEYFKSKYNFQPKAIDQSKKFVFVIDEINRGEISKIFGELFFSIDPSYRGRKGAVKTQYSNLHDNDKEMFYVPENVYIIGSMNDIDRSVESFDFAMRRRFTWSEISAEKSAENMNLPDNIKRRMSKLNEQITQIEGLNTSYHVGGAYFLDIGGTPREDFDAIWNLRIEPLLKEYLRGIPDSDEKINFLKDVYSA